MEAQKGHFSCLSEQLAACPASACTEGTASLGCSLSRLFLFSSYVKKPFFRAARSWGSGGGTSPGILSCKHASRANFAILYVVSECTCHLSKHSYIQCLTAMTNRGPGMQEQQSSINQILCKEARLAFLELSLLISDPNKLEWAHGGCLRLTAGGGRPAGQLSAQRRWRFLSDVAAG